MSTVYLDEPIPSVLNLGAGVQSSTLALMLAHGELELEGVDARAVRKRKAGDELVIARHLERPTVAIFADTGWEPPAVYEHLERLEVALRMAPFPIDVRRVTAGHLRDDYLANAIDDDGQDDDGARARFAAIPVHVLKPNSDRPTILRRQCTREYKLEPIRRELKALGYGPKNPVASLVGISLDELQRAKPGDGWAGRAHPLIDNRLTRHGCKRWLEAHGWDAPRSSCVGCPLHSSQEWRNVKADPDAWADALAFDRAIRTLPRVDGEAFLHFSAQPLDEVDLSTPQERGQGSLFDDECAGVCGV